MGGKVLPLDTRAISYLPCIDVGCNKRNRVNPLPYSMLSSDCVHVISFSHKEKRIDRKFAFKQST